MTKNEETNIGDIPTGELNEYTGEDRSRLLFEVYLRVSSDILRKKNTLQVLSMHDLTFEKTR